ncbi:LysR family transcriptional regulator [Ursidibacter arcticus]
MINRFEALKYFCIASETLNFRETAIRLSVSPPVVSRVIAELESELGEPLFTRNTRNIRLTTFGELFLPKAQQLLHNSDELFSLAKQNIENEMVGTVRITLPHIADHTEILQKLLHALADYPNIVIDWRVDAMRLNTVNQQIDMGLRVGREPEPTWIVRHIADLREEIVASPLLIERLGEPTDWQDFIKRYPIPVKINRETGRAWGWHLNEQQSFIPNQPAFVSLDGYSELAAALSGRCCAFLLNSICGQAIKDGRLNVLFPHLPRQTWKMYLYRPYNPITPKRVLVVFDLLTQILRGCRGEE